MTRRTLTQTLVAGLATRFTAQAEVDSANSSPPPGYSVVEMGGLKHFMPNKPEQIAMLIYPGMTALDLIGPQQAFGYMMGAKVSLLWKTLDPVVTDTGVKIIPTATFHETHEPDILFVPGGGKGTIDLMGDEEVLAFLIEQGKTARWVTSVCSGSLVLGAAGLLRGYRATSHWAVRDVLPNLGAQLANGRIVEDRNRITAGGVTAGIDFGLFLAGKLRGQDYGRALELMLEYDPHPPFHSGTPAEAPTNVRDVATSMYAPLLKLAQASAEAARARWAKA
jgi:cyclohexyl-isocyanide hydratase